MRAKVVAVERTTPSTVTLTLRPNRGWTGFGAGQHTQVTVEIDGVRHTRCYSPACSQYRDDGRIELTVKAHPGGTVSRHLVDHAAARPRRRPHARTGRLRRSPTSDPSASCSSAAAAASRRCCRCCARSATRGHTGAITFVHYALTADDHVYRAELDAIAAANPNVRLVRIYTDAPGTGDVDGFFTAEQLEAIEPAWRDTLTYVCGPAPLMDGVRDHYAAAGLADRHHDEAFTLATVVAESTGGTVTFGATGTTAVDDGGRSLLEQAEAAGLTPEYGCRMGICHTCT